MPTDTNQQPTDPNANVSESETSMELNVPGKMVFNGTDDIFSALPVTKNRDGDSSNGNGNADILAAIQELSNKHDKTFCKSSVIEMITETTSKHVQKLSSTVEQLVVDVNRHKEILKHTEAVIEDLKKENHILRAGVAECKRYSWRWALKLHGLKEEANEDVRKRVIDVVGNVAPGPQEYL